MARLEALIFHWRERPEIDPERVYVVGFSNGGFMAHRLACFMDDRLAAIVSIGGAGRAREEACGPTTPIAVAEIHGDADPVVAYGGGRIFNDHALDPHPSSRDTFHDWAERLGCLSQVGKTGNPGRPGRTSRPPISTRGCRAPETTIESYANCPLGTAELWTVHGGGHQVMTPALMKRVGDFLAANPKGPRGAAEG